MAGCADLCTSLNRAHTAEEQRYGVRSYLHLFYEDCTGSVLEDEDEEAVGLRIQRSPSNWRSSLWKVGLSAGTILFLIGMATVTTGYLVPRKMEGIGEDDFLVVDKRAIEYNEALEISKLVGAVLFSVGGTAIAACVLVLTISRHLPRDEERQFSPILMKGPQQRQHKAVLKTGSPGSAQLPVGFTRVQSVQPKAGT